MSKSATKQQYERTYLKQLLLLRGKAKPLLLLGSFLLM